jgi:hypothetical protein
VLREQVDSVLAMTAADVDELVKDLGFSSFDAPVYRSRSD